MEYLELLKQFDVPTPRYTSYPTAPEWNAIDSVVYEEHLAAIRDKEEPLSLYIHVPFCKTMCLYCACSVVLNRNPENEARYVRYLCTEIARVSSCTFRKRVCQIHFGGGTPTKLSQEQLATIMEALHRYFIIEKDAEIAIEIDPRTVVDDDGDKLQRLAALGFTRVSFGVQDTNNRVQEAVRRRQSYAMTEETVLRARACGFEGINVDLIYGLPYQTLSTFRTTVEQIAALSPDRIALFSYAKVPWLKPHQKAIRDETLPKTEEKFLIYLMARRFFTEQGYVAVGMDHFAKKCDALAEHFMKRTLHRNFQGYTILPVDTLIGFGMTAIGYVNNGYFQNAKSLDEYYRTLDQNIFPTTKGKVLSKEDLLRRWVIQSIMCNFSLSKDQFFSRFGISFDIHFQREQQLLAPFVENGLVTSSQEHIVVTEVGELFVRNIAAVFDAYYTSKQGAHCFSKAV